MPVPGPRGTPGRASGNDHDGAGDPAGGAAGGAEGERGAGGRADELGIPRGYDPPSVPGQTALGERERSTATPRAQAASAHRAPAGRRTGQSQPSALWQPADRQSGTRQQGSWPAAPAGSWRQTRAAARHPGWRAPATARPPRAPGAASSIGQPGGGKIPRSRRVDPSDAARTGHRTRRSAEAASRWCSCWIAVLAGVRPKTGPRPRCRRLNVIVIPLHDRAPARTGSPPAQAACRQRPPPCETPPVSERTESAGQSRAPRGTG